MTSPSPAVSGLTPEERVGRVKMALAEDGWPRAEVKWHAEAAVPNVVVGPGLPIDPPLASVWRALILAGESPPCWPCASTRDGDTQRACDHDPVTSPWPPLPSPPTIAGPTEEER